jgi:hypothetical protein
MGQQTGDARPGKDDPIMPPTHRIRVALKAARNNIPVLLALAQAIYNALKANANLFTQPNPALAILSQQIQDLETAHQATFTRAKGTIAARNAKRDVLVTSLECERMYVQSLCDANPEQAETYITAAGMGVARAPVHAKPVLAAEQGPAPGSAKLVANATLLVGRGVRKRATFNWQVSTDGGKTWTGAPSTPLASTIVEGLTPMTTYSFRVSATVSKAPGAWSQAVTLLVR